MSANSRRWSLLAEFLRTRRARLNPTRAGLPSGNHRRVPGLRLDRHERAYRVRLAFSDERAAEWYLPIPQHVADVVRWPAPPRRIVAALRVSYAQHAGDPTFEEPVAESLAKSALFAEPWNESRVLSPADSARPPTAPPYARVALLQYGRLADPGCPARNLVVGLLG